MRSGSRTNVSRSSLLRTFEECLLPVRRIGVDQERRIGEANHFVRIPLRPDLKDSLRDSTNPPRKRFEGCAPIDSSVGTGLRLYRCILANERFVCCAGIIELGE